MGKLDVTARRAPIALLATLAGCAGWQCETLSECQLPVEMIAATAAQACRDTFPGADPEPLRDPLVHRVGANYEVHIYVGEDRSLHTTGNLRLGLRWPQAGGSLAALAWPQVVATPVRGGAAPRHGHGELRILVQPRGDRARVTLQHRGLATPTLVRDLLAGAHLAQAVAAARRDPTLQTTLPTTISASRERSPRVAPDWLASAELLCAESALASGDLAAATRHLDRALDHAPQRFAARVWRAELAQLLAQPAVAARELDIIASLPGAAAAGLAAHTTRLAAHRDAHADAPAWLAAARASSEDTAMAWRFAQRARAVAQDDDGPALHTLADLAARAGNPRLASEFALGTLGTQPSAAQRLAISQLRLAAGDARGAVLWLAEGWDELAGDTNAHTLLAELGSALGAADMARTLALGGQSALSEQFARTWPDRAGRALLARVPTLAGFGADLPASPWR